MNKDLKLIKKYYGEKMMHLCRELFSTLLEKEGCLSKILLDNFAPNKFLYNDIVVYNIVQSFKDYIYELSKNEIKPKVVKNKTPEELLKEVGYQLYECKTEREIQGFKKYYAKGEELCTFKGGRLNECYVFFAVRNNVNDIKRNNFSIPERQDEYGTSVISIQFSRGETNTLSIKNRYNHTVSNPDATYSNNLENIIEGLTDSFEKKYKLKINQNDSHSFWLPNYVKANDGKYYKYNYEINNVYYCPNNIIIDNFEVKHLPKEKYIILDYFILDLVNKTIIYDNNYRDSFVDGLKNIQKINIINNKEENTKTIEIEIQGQEKIIIKIDKTNQIIEYKNNNIKTVGDYFLIKNRNLSKLEMNKVEEIGSYFLELNLNLVELNLQNVKRIGDKFLFNNLLLKSIKLENLEEICDKFMYYNTGLFDLNLPKLKKVGSYFLNRNKCLKQVRLPSLEEVGDYFLEQNENISEVFLPVLHSIGYSFMEDNKGLITLNLPNIQGINEGFLLENENLQEFNAPKLLFVDDMFLPNNKKLKILNLPNLERINTYFLYHNLNSLKLYLPKLDKNQKELLTPYFNFVNTEKELYETSIKKVDRINESLKNQLRIIRKKIIIKQYKDYDKRLKTII